MKPMADLRRSPHTAIWISKLVILLIAIVSVVVIARFAVPYAVSALSSAVPRLWSSFRGWLVPPYLFITVHLIIITIWKLSDHKLHKDHTPEEEKFIKPRDHGTTKHPSEIFHDIPPSPMVSGENLSESDATTPIPVSKSDEFEETSDASCITTDSDEISTVSSRLDIKKNIKPAEEEEEPSNNSLEDTWKTIRLKKSGTWERSHRAEVENETTTVGGGARELKESKTFKEPPAVVRGSESLAVGHDEWNQRFEAFIKKNYDQIRLQTEDSYRRHVEMVNRASY